VRLVKPWPRQTPEEPAEATSNVQDPGVRLDAGDAEPTPVIVKVIPPNFRDQPPEQILAIEDVTDALLPQE
jgi:hypothetical protein